MNRRIVWAWLVMIGIALGLVLMIGSVTASAQSADPTGATTAPAQKYTGKPTHCGTSVGMASGTGIITGTTPAALAESMGIVASALISASLNGSDVRALGIGTTPIGRYFPSEGGTFAILSTGLAQSAEWPNSEEDLSFELDGLDNSQFNDLVQLALRLRVPADLNCATLDFAFYSEEFPEYVGSVFNDTFTAELGGTDLVISDTQVIAPLNFAFDTEGNVMSINTVFGVAADTGTTYDGGTSRLRAQTPVTPGAIIDIVFSVQDLGDSIYDSAVFLDRFSWSDDPECQGGAQQDFSVFVPLALRS